ncbi:uncharacterized protein LOC143911948 [Arctopsyche grandis]|uniref:uncharacterized protein LOC143911948 n=1 Tax=Arctopsyche grandis TaxID=121162 RepID=UPI00406D84E4
MLLKICTLVALSAIFNYCVAEESILDDVSKGLSNVGEAIGSSVHKAVDTVKHTAANAKEGISHQVENMKDHASNAKDSVSDSMDDVKDKLHDVQDKVGDTGESFLDTIGRHANEAAKKIKEAAQSVGEKFGEATDYIGEKIGVIKPKMEDAGQSIKETISGFHEGDLESLHRSRLVRRSSGSDV